MLVILLLLRVWSIFMHFREPGQTHKEDIHTGALAAAAGGVTTVVMMANTNPVISDVKTLQEVLASAAKEKIHIYTNASVTQAFNGKDVTDFKALLEAGAVSFSDDGIPLESSKVLKKPLIWLMPTKLSFLCMRKILS